MYTHIYQRACTAASRAIDFMPYQEDLWQPTQTVSSISFQTFISILVSSLSKIIKYYFTHINYNSVTKYWHNLCNVNSIIFPQKEFYQLPTLGMMFSAVMRFETYVLCFSHENWPRVDKLCLIIQQAVNVNEYLWNPCIIFYYTRKSIKIFYHEISVLDKN